MPKSIHQIIYPETNLQPFYNAKILVIGVGGIGCQILKVVSKFPLSAIHIVDMDTIQVKNLLNFIQASNLNRQFLFKQHHRGHSKSLTAKDALLEINPKLNIISHHLNIKQLKIGFFKQFSFLIMALDNVDARNYVNKIGVRLNIPIIDAGTLGYKGNANTIIPSLTKCYACQLKSTTQTVFPVCTIRSRPQKPIHCIMWAKLLFEVFFGPDNEDNDLNDLKNILKQNNSEENSFNQQSKLILAKLFNEEIQGLKNLKNEAQQQKDKQGYAYINFSKKLKPIDKQLLLNTIQNQNFLQKFNDFDKKLDTKTNIQIFQIAYKNLSDQRQRDGLIVFEKDDDNIIHFVSSAANLRMQCFSIQNQNFYDVKNMAGNIIPAIASTNSIVSGLQIVEMMKIITQKRDKLKSYFVQNLATKLISTKLQNPSPLCKICTAQAIPVIFEVNMKIFTCGELIEKIKQNCPDLQQFSLNIGSDEIYNSEQPKETLLKKTLNSIVLKGKDFEKVVPSIQFLLTNQQTSQRVCNIWVVDSQTNEVKITNKQKMIIKKHQQQKPKHFQEMSTPLSNEQLNNNHINNDDSSDDLICMDDNPINGKQQSDQIQIIEVKKRLNQNNMRMQIQKQEGIQNLNGKKHVKID